jgi:hypothetical protein
MVNAESASKASYGSWAWAVDDAPRALVECAMTRFEFVVTAALGVCLAMSPLHPAPEKEMGRWCQGHLTS